MVQLNVASKDYWIYTNSPYDNDRKRLAFERLGFERGLEFLAAQQRVGDAETLTPSENGPRQERLDLERKL